MLSESPVDTIQLFRIGTFHHSQYGKFEITSEMLAEIKKNFDQRVRGIDIAVDYKHESDDVAAGWIKDLYLSDDNKALYAKVDWTPEGKKVLSDKEFRYISPEFSTDYQDNETLKKFGPVLLGAGLTNRPVIKKMEPVIELSEVTEEKPEVLEESKPVINLSKGERMQGEKKCADLSPEEMMALIDQLKKENEELKASHDKMMADKKYSEKKSQFQKLMTEGKACAAQEEAWMSDDMIKFAELSQPVKLAEAGTKVEPVEQEIPGENVDDKIHKLAEKLVNEKIVKTFSEAYSRVLREHPELREAKYNN